MKRKKIMILAGAFVLLTLLVGMKHDEPMYEKKKIFTTSSELLEQLNERPLVKEDYKGSNKFNDDTLECFSERKRLSGIDANYSKLDIKEIMKVDDNIKNSILYQYNQYRSSFSKRKPIDRAEVVRIKALPYYHNYSDNQIEYVPYNNAEYMDIVLVDEGEGLVIDYMRNFSEEHLIEDEIDD